MLVMKEIVESNITNISLMTNLKIEGICLSFYSIYMLSHAAY